MQNMEPPPKPGNKIVIRRRCGRVHNDSSGHAHTGTGNTSYRSENTFHSGVRTENGAPCVNANKDEDYLERFKILLAN